MTRKNYYELKASLVGKKHEIKRLKKALKQTKETQKEKLEDWNKLMDITIRELEITQKSLAKSRKKKWYQFEQI